MACVLTSNGLLVPRRIDRLRRLDTLVLSLDAPGPANDAVRGAGVFAAVGAAIAAAKAAACPRQAQRGPVGQDGAPSRRAARLRRAARPPRHRQRHALGRTGPLEGCRAIQAEDDEIRRLLERLAAKAAATPRLLFSPATYRYAAGWGDYAAIASRPPSCRRRRLACATRRAARPAATT